MTEEKKDKIYVRYEDDYDESLPIIPIDQIEFYDDIEDDDTDILTEPILFTRDKAGKEKQICIPGRYNYQMDEGGVIRVKNFSAHYLPELTVYEDIGGTLYKVTTAYEGDHTFASRWNRYLLEERESV